MSIPRTRAHGIALVNKPDKHESNYGHFDQAMSRAVALKNFSFSKEGILVRSAGFKVG
jgi:hypothetical protein